MTSFAAFAGGIPFHYETYLGPLFFEPYAQYLAERVVHSSAQQVLELACGTGRLTHHLAHTLAMGSQLIATDISEEMITVARQKVNAPFVEWKVADAHQLPFADGFFDLVVCQFGVMFFANKLQAFQEVQRVLRPAGDFYFSTWCEVQENALARIANTVMQEEFGENSPAFFENGPYAMHNQSEIHTLLESAGFTPGVIDGVALTAVAATADDAVRGMLQGTPLSTFLQGQGERAARVTERFRNLLVQQYGAVNLQLPMKALVCKAGKP